MHRGLYVQLKEVKPAPALAKSMCSLSNHVKMLAVTSIALLAEDQAAWQRKQRTSHRGSRYSDQDEALLQKGNRVTEELVQALERLLEEDSVVHVKVPSAITLYAINRHTTRVREHLSCCPVLQHNIVIILLPNCCTVLQHSIILD